MTKRKKTRLKVIPKAATKRKKSRSKATPKAVTKSRKPRLKIIPKDEELLPASLLDRPPWLPDEAARLWDALVIRLKAAGVLDEVDGPALLSLVMSYYFTLHAGALLLKDGMLEMDEAHADRKRKHPAFQMWRDSQAAFAKWADRFEVNPAAREGPLTDAHGELSELEKLLGGTKAAKR